MPVSPVFRTTTSSVNGRLAQPARTRSPAGGWQIQGLAFALVEDGRDVHSTRLLTDLAAPDAAKAVLTVIWNRMVKRKSTYVYQHAYVIGDLGRWAKPPDKGLDQLRLFQRNLSPGGTGMTENNRRAERVLRLLAGRAFEVRPPAVAGHLI